MAKRKKGGALLPFAAGIAVGYLLFNKKNAGAGANTNLPTTIPEVIPNAPKGNTAPILTINGPRRKKIGIGAMNFHQGGTLQPNYDNYYL